ncbi:MAG: tRNA (adenosine(37)-N6)-threonylcarbamoyltransferase complex ATPase subunit type 1 TsaE [Defluviitaleaceae bacterium]|nr:tRNA (adenosine(37)-N6)-threonylcarbamoyltransferase complex ATPase subunit type 1 TsaE [Defluviitaleaceae bacterium]
MTVYESCSAEETEAIAAEYGINAVAGDIICLSGTLGAGKTVFARGVAKGLGYTGRVTSPTFTIMNIYEGGRLPLYHFDLYRLEGGIADLEGIGYEDYFFADGVCLIEWPEMAENAMPPGALRVEILGDFSKDAEFREIRVVR